MFPFGKWFRLNRLTIACTTTSGAVLQAQWLDSRIEAADLGISETSLGPSDWPRARGHGDLVGRRSSDSGALVNKCPIFGILQHLTHENLMAVQSARKIPIRSFSNLLLVVYCSEIGVLLRDDTFPAINL